MENIAEQIGIGVASKFQSSFESYKLDSVVSSLFHELRAPMVNLKYAFEYLIKKVSTYLELFEGPREFMDADKLKQSSTYNKVKIGHDKALNPYEVLKDIMDIIDKDLSSSIYRLEHILDTMQLLSKIYMGEEIEFEKQPVNIFEKEFFGQIINDIKRIFYVQMQDKELELNYEYSMDRFPASIVLGEDKLNALRIILHNLIMNAVKYSDPKTEILVEGEVKGENVLVYFKNWGIGVPEGEEELIFEKGRRGSNAKKRARSGKGLGLYFARILARKLGGDLILTKSHNPTTFLLKLPLRYFTFKKRR